MTLVKTDHLWGHLGMAIVKSATLGLTVRAWSGAENIPGSGGFVIVANHVSEFDPLVLAHFVLDAGRWPRFLAKSSLFAVPGLGMLLTRLRQIPVARGGSGARDGLGSAITAVREGHGVVVYPEGTTPKNGDFALRRGKPGAARLFLATGAPVIPVAVWGPQRVFDPGTHTWTLSRRSPVAVQAGPALDLTGAGLAPSGERLRNITDHIMGGLADRLAVVRGGQLEAGA
jgi:1-acyl-sn-glycerol-3-phosphate acyltransferase